MHLTNQTVRVLELLKRFNSGEKVCLESLLYDKLWEGKSLRTIRRDLEIVKEYFPESFELIRGGKGEKSCYRAITKELFENFMNHETITLMVQTFNILQRHNILESLDIDEETKRLLVGKLKNSKNCYEFISKPYESKIGDEKLLNDLEKAIQGKRYINLEYEINGKVEHYKVKPYKIIFINENFYLGSENTDKSYIFSMFKLYNIKNIHVLGKTFHIDPDINSFIKQIHTPFANYSPMYKENLIDVEIKVDAEKAKYFFQKNIFLHKVSKRSMKMDLSLFHTRLQMSLS